MATRPLQTYLSAKGLWLAAVEKFVVETDIETVDDFDAKLDLHFTAPGPTVFVWRIERADEPVPKPSAPIRQRTHALRAALVG